MRVELQNLLKSFGKLRAIDNVSLSIPSGELVALLGPSGSGKTSLLRVVGGLDAPASGRVLFDGEDTVGWPIQRRRVGFVFQNYALFRNLTVFENIAFGLRALPRRERPKEAALRSRVRELLELIHLPDLEQRYPAQLSGGQQQRVALARALAINPRVLLLDEPFGALDAQVRKELRRWVRQIHEQTGLTTLFVTHDQDEALELADRLVVLNRGRIEQLGTPDEIFDHPVSKFVHEFVGESSALAVQVGNGRVTLDGRALDLISPGVADGPAWLLVRPQHLALGNNEAGAIPAVVSAVLRVGAHYRIEARVGAGHARIEVEQDSRPDLHRGDSVFLKPLRWRLYPRDLVGAGTSGDAVPASVAPPPHQRAQREFAGVRVA